MKRSILVFSLATVSTLSFASEENRTKYGLEVDVLPYLTGGHYLSAWFGGEEYRFRAVYASVSVPDFIVKDGFEDNTLDAYAVIVDYFPGGNLSGWWYGAGFEVWDSEISEAGTSQAAEFKNYVGTAGVGYIWALSESVYVNPWGAVHAIVGGDREVQVGNSVYKPDPIVGEVSLKLGYVF